MPGHYGKMMKKKNGGKKVTGKKSSETGERYLPEKAIKSLSSAEYAATTKAKRQGTKRGKQFVKQPKGIAKKTAKYRSCLLYTSPSPRDGLLSRMPSSA